MRLFILAGLLVTTGAVAAGEVKQQQLADESRMGAQAYHQSHEHTHKSDKQHDYKQHASNTHGKTCETGKDLGEGCGCDHKKHDRKHHDKQNAMKQRDENKDGTVSRAEFLRFSEDRFDRMDTNKDGVLNSSDREAHEKHHKQQKKQ